MDKLFLISLHFLHILLLRMEEIILKCGKNRKLEETGCLMLNPVIIANTILYYAFKEKILITPTKLQSIIFLLYIEYIKLTNKKLFREDFQIIEEDEIVFPSLYYEVYNFGNKPITKFFRDKYGKVHTLSLNNKDFLKCWDKVWKNTKHLSTKQISQLVGENKYIFGHAYPPL